MALAVEEAVDDDVWVAEAVADADEVLEEVAVAVKDGCRYGVRDGRGGGTKVGQPFTVSVHSVFVIIVLSVDTSMGEVRKSNKVP